MSTHRGTPQRVSSCFLCQQRKVKCDRKIPCATCRRSQSPCVPATVAPRRQRFAERDLLARLRTYENLLHQNHIIFEPLHPERNEEEAVDHTTPRSDVRNHGFPNLQTEASTPADATLHSGHPDGARSAWLAMSGKYHDSDSSSGPSPDEMREQLRDALLKGPCMGASRQKDHLLLGSREGATVDLFTLHPDPVGVFRLWDIYLKNVDPLLKITHRPSLQPLLVEATCDTAHIRPALEALMFGIYSIAVLSLSHDECAAIFNTPKEELQKRYHFACQEALINADFLRTTDRTCLTALYFYLTSIHSTTDPFYVSSLLGIAFRTAQRLGLDSEVSNIKCDAFEAEMRRRLWWALVHFDARISDMIQSKSSTFSSIWDCKVPLNVNDSDLDPGLKKPPSNRDMPTEATFIAIRGIIADHVRATSSHLDFINPASRPLAKNAQIDLASGNRNSVASLEQTIEDKYLSVCDLDNSVQFMTVWMARGLLAKYHLLEQYSKLLNVPTPPTDMQHDNANMHALKMLECDTNITRSPLTKRYLWMAHIYFPFPAYLQLFQDCKRRPLSLHIQRGWEALSENYIARREAFHQHEDNSLFRILAELVLQAWKARISALRNEGETTIAEPHLVSHVKERLARFSSNTTSRTTNGAVALNPHDIVTSDCAVSTHHLDMTNNMLEPQALVGLTSMEYPAQSGMYGMTLDSLGWAAMDWSFGSSPNGY